MADLDSWIEIVRECKYLPENDLKQLCDLVCDLLLEESNIQPVSTPVTVCGDIHGQVIQLKIQFSALHHISFVFIKYVIDFVRDKNCRQLLNCQSVFENFVTICLFLL